MRLYFWGKHDRDGTELSDNVCGTPACVLGHYLARQFGEERYTLPMSFKICRIMQGDEDHGLSEFQLQSLFGAHGCGGAQTPEHAIAYIEKFIVKHGGELEPELEVSEPVKVEEPVYV